MTIYPWQQAPRFPLAHLPTPLEPLDRLSREFGGPRIWVKRDDCTGLAGGGNKTRKLEFLLGDAVAQQADTIVTFGAVQSNHCRQTAAAAARAGMACHLILSRRVRYQSDNYESGGNVLLDRLLDAELHMVEPSSAADYTRDLLQQLKSRGAKPYVIPAGGSNHVGALGYAMLAQELADQADRQGIELRRIVHASASAGTQSGLLWGLSCIGSPAQVFGVNVFHPDPATLQQRIEAIIADLQQAHPGAAPSQPKISVNHAYFGDGYGQPTQECIRAIRTAARLEALLFDPVYSGKALAALLDQIDLGNFDEVDDVVLIHTGGAPALHVYHDALLA